MLFKRTRRIFAQSKIKQEAFLKANATFIGSGPILGQMFASGTGMAKGRS